MAGTDLTGAFRWFDKPLIEDGSMFSATLASPVMGICRVFIDVTTGVVRKVLESR